MNLEVQDSHTLVPPTVFGKREPKKIPASTALPPATGLEDMWDFRDFIASGLDKKGKVQHNALKTGKFIKIARPNMSNYVVRPQYFASKAPLVQDGFKDLTNQPFQAPSTIATPTKEYELWERTARDSIKTLNHLYWFHEGSTRSFEEISIELDKLQTADSPQQVEQGLKYIKNCASVQGKLLSSLGKGLNEVLDSTMTHTSNLLLNRRDNFLKMCNSKVTDQDLKKLRNSSLTSTELFNPEKLSEVQDNFIKRAHLKTDDRVYKKPKVDLSYTKFVETKKDPKTRYQNPAFRNVGDTQTKRQNFNAFRGSARGRGGRGGRK